MVTTSANIQSETIRYASQDGTQIDAYISQPATPGKYPGIIVAMAIFFFRDEAPWWMPIFAGTIITAIMFRLLRPRLRHPSIEDEI